ncbi:hypothetical protein [Xanthomonas phage pXoo2107]|nr:hypothetical protein [Xanthomonas phage pXoo2107]
MSKTKLKPIGWEIRDGKDISVLNHSIHPADRAAVSRHVCPTTGRVRYLFESQRTAAACVRRYGRVPRSTIAPVYEITDND